MNSLALIGNTKTVSSKRLEEEALGKGITFRAFSSDSFVLDYNSKGMSAAVEDQRIDTYDAYLFRGVKKSRLSVFGPLAQSLLKQGKRVVEKSVAHGNLPNDKLVPVSKKGLYLVPESRIVFTEEALYKQRLSYPTVVKGLQSSMGREVFLVESQKELQEVASGLNSAVLLQEYLPISWDARVLVIGGTVIGGIKRFRDETCFLTTKPGGKREVFTITSEVAQAAQESANLQGLEIAGIDLAVYNNKIYIFEVNASPQFRVFEKVTGINVAKLIIEHLDYSSF